MSRPRAAPSSNGAKARPCRACRSSRTAQRSCARRAEIRILFLLALFAICTPASAGELKYFEIVKEIPDCKGKECFIEYVALSDGQIVKKQIDAPEQDSSAAISVRKADVAGLFAQAGAIFEGAAASTARTSDPESLYYYDGEKFFSYNSSDPADAKFIPLFQATAAAFDKGSAAQNFYVHAYYTPLKGNIKDYHVFSDGTVIASMFGKETYMMVYTFLTSTDKAEVDALAQLGDKAVGAPAKNYTQCKPETGLVYGFVEMQVEKGYIRSYSCGDEGDPVANLFSHIRGAFDGLGPK